MMSTFSLATFLCSFAASLCCMDLETACRFADGMVVNDVCLYVPHRRGTFNEGVAFCEEKGGQLAYPESAVEFEIMEALCEDNAAIKGSKGRYGCHVGWIHNSKCNYVSYDRKMRLPAYSPWWYNGEGRNWRGKGPDDCRKYNRAKISFTDKKPFAEMTASRDGLEWYFICKLKREQLEMRTEA